MQFGGIPEQIQIEPTKIVHRIEAQGKYWNLYMIHQFSKRSQTIDRELGNFQTEKLRFTNKLSLGGILLKENL
jgi:hypothetical protein